jgi:hypothetical protein
MKNLLAFLAAAVIMFGGVGWYLDWFQIFNGPAASGHYNVNLDFNARKIEEDVKNGEAKVAEAVEKARKDAAANKASAGNTDPVTKQLSEPVKPLVGASQK